MKAFTIVEIIVVLIITSIVISASMLLYFNMNKIQHSSFNKGEEEAAFILLTDVIRKDSKEAQSLRFANNELYCIKEKETISYEFAIDYMVRKAMIADTFAFKASSPVIGYVDSAHRIVNSLSFILSLKNDSIPFYLYKQYSPQFFINQNASKP
ncbi:MAG: hypothetical protein JXQ69_00980 [Paludibacteraceae bacterium]|nr:hypothetical protein [Paludibacteraceae bacterium]